MNDYASKYYLKSQRPHTLGDWLISAAVWGLAAGMLLSPLWLG